MVKMFLMLICWFDYLKSYFDEDVEFHQIYRYLDRLHNTLQDKIQQISVEHTRKILGVTLGLFFTM